MAELPASMLRSLSELLARRMGLHFPERRWRDLEKGFLAALPDLGCEGPQECFERLLAADLSKTQIEILASRLTVGETYFFRDQPSFAALEGAILPELIRRREGNRRLRLWSAGCATGEEPYSLAILLRRLLSGPAGWNVTILATDINPHFLEKAREAVYGDWSFRDCPSWIKNRYFEPAAEERHRLRQEIRELVTFSYLNLAEDVYPSLASNTTGMDLILCRNVLMYFSEETRRRVVRNLHRCLVADGFLLVSATEISHALFARFTPMVHAGTTFYRKDGEGLGGAREPAAPPLPGAASPLPEPSCGLPENPTAAGGHVPLPEAAVPPPSPGPPGAARKPEPGAASLLDEVRALLGQGRYAEAVEAMRERMGNEDQAAVAAMLARAYANLGLMVEALAWGRQAAAADKMNPALHYLVAMIEQENGLQEEAAASLRKAVYLDGHFVLAHFALGNLALRRGRRAEARRHFRNALSLLAAYGQDEAVPESEGVTAGRMGMIIRGMIEGMEPS
ncbi:MAG: protein-glutamate O-methyltransferase CheR [Desulfobacteraceae bacterium]|nr:protein-glutamate O-methyltransferase CheR [Desulfobacteraceae bacterium]